MIQLKLSTIFTSDEMARLSINEVSDSELRIIADVHGMKCKSAKRFINNIINVVRRCFVLVVIHGFNHGTAIKDMLADGFANSHIQGKYQDISNLGVTYLRLV